MSYIISGNKTKDDWDNFKPRLNPGKRIEWQKVVEEYFKPRLNDRYLKPIQAMNVALEEQGEHFNGEGFAIMTILCSLIEFLESTYQGKLYVHGGTGQYKYSKSGQMFKNFLTHHKPFKNVFTTKKLASDFYKNIRCGLLHEASTKNGWLIHAKGPLIIDTNGSNKIVYRDQFKDAIEQFISRYSKALLRNNTLQENFIRKWDSL